MNCMKEPVHLKCSGGLINVSSRRELICLKCSEGLVDECLKHSSYTRVVSSFSHLFYSNFIIFVARSLIWCLVWLQIHWSVKSSFWKQFLEQ